MPGLIVADTVIDLMKGHYQELGVRRDQIVEILSVEERKFGQTLTAGMRMLGDLLDRLEDGPKGRSYITHLAEALYEAHRTLGGRS